MYGSIRIHLAGNEDGDLTHQFQNFGEDVWRELSSIAAIDMNDIDNATDEFFVHKIRKRDAMTVSRTLDRLIRKHFFEGKIVVTRVAGTGAE